MLKHIDFPSASFPHADLRVVENTTYVFRCPSCLQVIQVDFGWIARGENHPSISPALISEAREHFPADSGNHLESVKCSSCNAEYLIHARVDETSSNAYGLEILGVVEII